MQVSLNDINNSIAAGVSYLKEHQCHNGEFFSYMSNTEEMAETGDNKWCVPEREVFSAVLIGQSLLFLENFPEVENILDKITAFVSSQREGRVWNFHVFNFGIFYGKKEFIVPFDIDDTVCASSLLKARNIKIPDNLDIILSNRDGKKLFYSWFVFRFRLNLNRSYWRLVLTDFLRHPAISYFFFKNYRTLVDAVVNANVLYYLGDNENTQAVIAYLLRVIAEEQENNCDNWYRTPFAVYYFFSRNYYIGIEKLEPLRAPIIERIVKKINPNGRIGKTVLETALALCTLLNLKYDGEEVQNVVAFLLNEQQGNGYWQRSVLYWVAPQQYFGWGSEVLTTAFCLEGLARYRHGLKN
jgi:hypothetical protein